MTRDQSRAEARNRQRLDRQLAIAGDESRPDAVRKRACRWAAALGEKLGLIERPGRCEYCRKGWEVLERHHPAYDMPLHVLYLCPSCHEIADAMDGTTEHRPRRAS